MRLFECFLQYIWLGEMSNNLSGHTGLWQLGNYPSFIVRLSFVIRSFRLGGGGGMDEGKEIVKKIVLLVFYL